MKTIKNYISVDKNPEPNQIRPAEISKRQKFIEQFKEALKSLSIETLHIENAISELTENPESKNDYEKITDLFFMDFLPNNLFEDHEIQ